MSAVPKARLVTIGSARLICGDAYEERPKLGFMHADVMDPDYLIRTEGTGRFRKERKHMDEIAEAGIDHVVLGTDYPFPWNTVPVDHVMAIPGLSDEDRIKILGGTAAKLLGIES